ncbi:MAG: hypothetical protein FD134_68 [Gallionellaceae bacterium]|nr:MAG: hypothetical protein FD134_68 [Gallionellaceae bacterium]
MGPTTKLGITCSSQMQVGFDKGTLVLRNSPQPSPELFRNAIKGNKRPFALDNAMALFEAYKYVDSHNLASSAVLRRTGYAAEEFISGLIPGMVMMLGVWAATTGLGAAIGAALGAFAGGFGAIPGGVAGGAIGSKTALVVMTWLGLSFLLYFIAGNVGELASMMKNAVVRAWDAGDLQEPKRSIEIYKAAEEWAEAVGLLVLIILQAIVAYITKNMGVKQGAALMQKGQALVGGGRKGSFRTGYSGACCESSKSA